MSTPTAGKTGITVTDSASDVDRLCIDTLRTLAMDAVQKANSGHPGTPMALAPVGYAVWHDFLRHNPANPSFANRDRFVLSCGHASMLLYGLLHLSGYDVTVDDMRDFRQFGAKCAGHPEYRHCPGVETTTGPLGQGITNSVGMAVAEKWLATQFNRPGFDVVDHRVIALCSDGDVMEGVAAEAASLAGHFGLDNLVWIYDANRITIDGGIDLTFSEDVAKRFDACGWDTLHVDDANDVASLRDALDKSTAKNGRPKLIVVESHIAWGSPNLQDTSASHGAPLGEDEIRATKEVYGWNPDARFHVPAEAFDHMAGAARTRGAKIEADWNEMFARYEKKHPELAARWHALRDGRLPDGWDADIPTFTADAKGAATRGASGKVLAAIAGRVPWLMGGSADLGSSNKTILPDERPFGRDDFGARNMFFGIREHAMGSIANGMALSGMRPFVATFLIFSDYCRPVHRLASMMKLPAVYVYTHDSIGVGEDGPTHQPIEQVASLRTIPGLDVVRPADANETAWAWRHAMERGDGPVALVLTRQSVPTFDRTKYTDAAESAKGGYVLADAPNGKPDVIFVATGSEVSLAVDAREQLAADGIHARVVSLPCQEQFERQGADYRESVLPSSCLARVGIEAGCSFGWERYVGTTGTFIGRDDFGASAPGAVLFREFGFTVEAVVAAAKAQVAS